MESFKDYKILSRRDNSTALLGTLNGVQSIVVVQNKEVDLKEIPKMKMEKYTVITDNPPYRSMESANYYLRVTSPCTQQHIKKYDRPEYRSETYDEYLEYLQKDKLSTNWIQKIRDGECEQPIYHDDRFIIINDYKWDMSDVSQLYLLLIFKDHGLFTIRELSLALCKEAKIMILQILSTRYGLEEKDVLMYFHYKPSYYVLHVHVVNLERRMEPGMMVGRAILLDDIVENLMIDPLYYKKRKLFYVGS
ncbi:hypothetical protein VCUG_01396 [Vavraia culicis subsp. floridensis]|uniref:Scavenger mRNA-decapping enzyme DcpS n=1 Tax=Vavraia culicis (isolate floridensis) TaxID=948595 RepID=L2GUY6_VAVCU|nr:uncharacterized protein VCUG_01396 [Vavraia culicis subsp. floridensis]ELA47123.1 hypothetical protein VCUG_01396 [Vavraia culicis subsp. floridensis]